MTCKSMRGWLSTLTRWQVVLDVTQCRKLCRRAFEIFPIFACEYRTGMPVMKIRSVFRPPRTGVKSPLERLHDSWPILRYANGKVKATWPTTCTSNNDSRIAVRRIVRKIAYWSVDKKKDGWSVFLRLPITFALLVKDLLGFSEWM